MHLNLIFPPDNNSFKNGKDKFEKNQFFHLKKIFGLIFQCSFRKSLNKKQISILKKEFPCVEYGHWRKMADNNSFMKEGISIFVFFSNFYEQEFFFVSANLNWK